MSPQERVKWTVESVREWASDLFASRDEAARIARDEAKDLRDSLRREAGREVRRIDQRLDDLERDMNTRLEDERKFRDEVRGQALTREAYEREHRSLEARVSKLEQLFANWQGKGIVYAIAGSITVIAITAIVTHLISGG